MKCFGGESESAVRIALARLGAEISTFKVFQIFRGQAGSLCVFFLAHLTLSLPWLMELCRASQLVRQLIRQLVSRATKLVRPES